MNEENKSGNRKFLLVIIIIIFIGSLGFLAYRLSGPIMDKINEIKEEKNQIKEDANAIKNKVREEQERIEKEIEEQRAQSKIDDFNNGFEVWSGTQTSSAVQYIIDEYSKINKKGDEHLVEYFFDNTSYGTNADDIIKIKDYLKRFNGHEIQYYEVILDYDENGYVNKVTIETR